ncbi:MAG: DNA repair exonuclease [Clostridia bacterium]|nr:DNA repair exonuclease [Clostridia bacterium]
MNSIKILHTGDLHLCSPMLNMGDKSNIRKGELLETFSNIIKLAESENADALFITGYLFENSNPDTSTLSYVSEEFEKIKHIKVFIVLGNHDYALEYNFPSNVHLFKNYIEKISIENADVYGVSFDDEHCNRCIMEGFTADSTEKINLLLVHGDVQSKSVYNPITTDDIRYSNMDYIALGHVHSHNGFEKAGATTYAYCGIPEGRAFDECGEKGVIIAEIGKGYSNCRFVPICGRKYLCKTVDITGVEDNLQIAEKIAAVLEGTENAYRVTLTGIKNTFADTRFIKEYLEKNYYYIEVEDSSEEYSKDEYSLKNLFVQNCHNDDALKYGLAALRGEKVIIE